MATRKINRVGASTLTVSIPSKWARKYGLTPGAEVEITEEGPTLSINSGGNISAPKKATIHLKKGQPFRRRFLTVMYRDGYDEIEITSEEPLDQVRMKQALEELFGFELIESHPKRIVVRNVATPKEEEFENIFRRLFLLTLSMARSILEDIKTEEYTHAKEVADMERTTNKFCYFCQRVLVRRDLVSRTKTLNMYHFAAMLEHMADDLKRICTTVGSIKQRLSTPVVQAFESYVALLEKLCENFYQTDMARVTALRIQRDAVYDKVYSLFKKKLRSSEYEIAGLLISLLGSAKGIETEMYHI